MGAAIFFGICFLIFFIWLAYYIANLFYEAAVEKGHDSRAYFWLSFLFGPAGYLLVVALPDLKTRNTIASLGKTFTLSEHTSKLSKSVAPKAATSNTTVDEALPEL